MLHKARPFPPLIAVVGTTGSMKSELALQLAKRFGAHIINSDALQVYSDLNIITNKLSKADQLSVPHHLLNLQSFTENPAGPPYSVRHFNDDATAIINKLHNQTIPAIIAGGTHYYLQYLLWGNENALHDSPHSGNPDFRALDPATLYAKLAKFDPAAAALWHPNDSRRVRRSLEQYYARNCTPMTHSPTTTRQELRYPTLVLWTHVDPESLKVRLDSRVDAMVQLGLFRELWSVWRAYSRVPESLRDKGAFQAIGFKEFFKYLDAVDQLVVKCKTSVVVLLNSCHDTVITDQEPDQVYNQLKRHVEEVKPFGDSVCVNWETECARLDQLRKTGLDAMKLATRQYAKRQISWIRARLVPRILGTSSQTHDMPAMIYKIDTSDSLTSELFARDIVDPLEPIVQQFLLVNRGTISPKLDSLNPLSTSKIVLLTKSDVHRQRENSPINVECQVCQRTFRNEHEWSAHQKSRAHRQLLKKRRKEKFADLILCLENIR